METMMRLAHMTTMRFVSMAAEMMPMFCVFGVDGRAEACTTDDSKYSNQIGPK
jgi:hypothetical protein